jgi:hypothetical protein
LEHLPANGIAWNEVAAGGGGRVGIVPPRFRIEIHFALDVEPGIGMPAAPPSQKAQSGMVAQAFSIVQEECEGSS